MTLTLTLAPDKETWLAAQARRAGLTPEQYVQSLIDRDAVRLDAPLAPGTVSPTMALFHRWSAEDATDDPDEIARRTRETDALTAALRDAPLSLRLPRLPDEGGPNQDSQGAEEDRAA